MGARIRRQYELMTDFFCIFVPDIKTMLNNGVN